MAAEFSDAPADLKQGASSLNEENLTSFDPDNDQHGAHAVTHGRKEDKESSVEKPTGATDAEGEYLDVKSTSDGANSSSQVDVGLEKNSEYAADEGAMGDENGSVESYDSALDRIAVASVGDPASPEVPSSPVFQPAEIQQQNALKQLNLWDTGISSLDTRLLENASPEEFRTRVAQIALAQGLSPGSDDVEQVLYDLLPLVEAKESHDVQSEAELESKNDDSVLPKDDNTGGDLDKAEQDAPLNKHTSSVGDIAQNPEEQASETLSSHAEGNGNLASDELDEPDIQPVEEDASKESMPNHFKDAVGDLTDTDSTKKQSQPKVANRAVEPEVIDWNDANESDVDEYGNRNPADQQEGLAKNLSSEDAALSLQDNEGGDEVTRSSRETKMGATDSVPLDAEVDGGEKTITAEPRSQSGFQLDDNSAISGEISGDTASMSANVTNMQERDGNTPVTNVEADNLQPGSAKEVDSKIESSEGGSAEPGDAEMLKGRSSDVAGVSEGVLITEKLAAPTPYVELDRSLKPEVAKEQHESEQSSRPEEAADSLVRTGESILTVAGPAKVTSAVVNEMNLMDETGTQEEGEQPFTDVVEESSLSDGAGAEEEGMHQPRELSEEESSIPVTGKTTQPSANDSTPSLGAAGPSLPVRPAGLGRSMPSLEHAPRVVQRSSGAPASARQTAVTNEENQASADVSEGNEDAREKLQMIRVKFLRLALRLGQSVHNVVVAQVLYRLGLAEQLRGGRGSGRSGAYSFERASVLAEEQEAAGADLEFGCTIMVLGKTGVGKSATINSLFDEVKSGTNAYTPATTKVQEIVGTVHGIKLRVIDTPGLLTSFTDQRHNERIMSSVKRFIKKSPPDIVLYFDRLDMQSRDYGDLPLLRTITDTFGSAVWFNAIVVLTHASSAPPDGTNGVPVSYEMFVAQRSHLVQQTIRQAAGDMRLMNPVSLVENHAACRRNRGGERVLPNGQVWKPQLLLLCFASKILAEANSLLKLQDNSPTKPFGVRSRVPPLPFLLSSLLQSRAQLKLPDEQVGTDDDESEDESDEDGESDGEEEYDDLPPFRRLTRDELKLLDNDQRRIYAEELEYREKLFMRKQLKDERARRKELKRRLAALPKEAILYAEEILEEENASAASVPVPMPDMALPPSFDSDNPTYRYRYLDAANQWLVRPVLETHGWDHDSGYDGLNVEKMFVVSKKIPMSVSGQVTKDKKEANLQMEGAASFKHGEGKVSQAGLDVQTIGKDIAYTLRSEIRFDNFKRNKTTCGLAVTLLGDTVAAGMKIEDRLLVGKWLKLVFNGGALTGRGDVAYGGSLEATIRDKDYPIGQFLSTFGLSVMDWHGDLAIGGNLQVQCKFGKTMTVVRGNLNNRRAGQVSLRVSSSEQLQMALLGLIPLLRTFINNRILSSN